MNFVQKTDEGELELVFAFLFEWGVVCVAESYLGLAETQHFSSQKFSQSNKHDTFWEVKLAGYLCFIFMSF